MPVFFGFCATERTNNYSAFWNEVIPHVPECMRCYTVAAHKLVPKSCVCSRNRIHMTCRRASSHRHDVTYIATGIHVEKEKSMFPTCTENISMGVGCSNCTSFVTEGAVASGKFTHDIQHMQCHILP